MMTGKSKSIIRFFPDWGPAWPLWDSFPRTPQDYGLSPELADRLREWTRVWQVDLDPMEGVDWPDREMGKKWIEEGHRLCDEVQRVVAPQGIIVYPEFDMYDPDNQDL